MKKKIVIKKQPCGCLCFGAEGGGSQSGETDSTDGQAKTGASPMLMGVCKWNLPA